MTRGLFDTRTVPGLIRTWALSGALLAAALVAWRLVSGPGQTPGARDLQFPVDGVSRDTVSDSFTDPRGTGRTHDAMDILAPRRSPVRAVDHGTIAHLATGGTGGIAVYQFDEAERYCYYYAHLERYVLGLREGQRVRRGDVIGYVGTSGNAPPSTPHLHFAIFKVNARKQWWGGGPVNPYPLLR